MSTRLEFGDDEIEGEDLPLGALHLPAPMGEAFDDPLNEVPILLRAATKPRGNYLPWLIGLLVAVVVFLSGTLFVTGRAEEFSASGSVIVLPKSENASTLASLYETLGRGQIVASFADVIRSQALTNVPPGASVTVAISPDSAILVVTGKAPVAADAERVAAEKIKVGASAIAKLPTPFTVEVVDDPKDSARKSGLSGSTLMAAIAGAALVLGVAAGQAVGTIKRANARS
jgi:capsular polysaccharide biosynthesis protein